MLKEVALAVAAAASDISIWGFVPQYLEHLQCRPSLKALLSIGPYGMDPFQSLLPKVTASYSIYVCRMLSWNTCMETILIQSFLPFLHSENRYSSKLYVARLHFSLGSQTSAFFTCNFSFFTMPWPMFFPCFFAPFLVDFREKCGNVGKFHFTKFSGRWMGVCAIYFHTRIEW